MMRNLDPKIIKWEKKINQKILIRKSSDQKNGDFEEKKDNELSLDIK
jgi:hypothetical protein